MVQLWKCIPVLNIRSQPGTYLLETAILGLVNLKSKFCKSFHLLDLALFPCR